MTELKRGLFKLAGRSMRALDELAQKDRSDGELLTERDLTKLNVPKEYSSFEYHDRYLEILGHESAAKLLKIDNPFFKEAQSVGSTHISINGVKLLNFSSYNYLNLTGEKKVNQAAINAINQYGTSTSGSRMVSGERTIIRLLEEKIASVYQADDALVMVSGHATNLSTISTLFSEDDLILFDQYSHNSIVMGIQLSGANKQMFKHNDLDHLESILMERRSLYKRVLIVVEGLYSMDGDCPDLKRLIELKRQYTTFLMVDEAHSLGVLGEKGLGLFDKCLVNPRDVDIWMGTLSKTLSSCGGYIAGNKALISILKYSSPGFVYSVGLSPPLAACALQALEMMLTEPKRVQTLKARSQEFYQKGKSLGLDLGLSEGHAILPIMCGGSEKAVKLSNRLYKEGVYALPIIYPAVSEQLARVRFFINSSHSSDEISHCLSLIKSYM